LCVPETTPINFDELGLDYDFYHENIIVVTNYSAPPSHFSANL